MKTDRNLLETPCGKLVARVAGVAIDRRLELIGKWRVAVPSKARRLPAGKRFECLKQLRAIVAHCEDC